MMRTEIRHDFLDDVLGWFAQIGREGEEVYRSNKWQYVGRDWRICYETVLAGNGQLRYALITDVPDDLAVEFVLRWG